MLIKPSTIVSSGHATVTNWTLLRWVQGKRAYRIKIGVVQLLKELLKVTWGWLSSKTGLITDRRLRERATNSAIMLLPWKIQELETSHLPKVASMCHFSSSLSSYNNNHFHLVVKESFLQLELSIRNRHHHNFKLQRTFLRLRWALGSCSIAKWNYNSWMTSASRRIFSRIMKLN